MALKRFVSASAVNELVTKGFINKEGIRILDCSYAIPQRIDWKLYRAELYGRFELLHKHPTPSIKLYLSGHIPGAVHMNLDAAVYPSQFERFTMYEPEMFEKYAQLLGINKGEHLILYSRGPLGGMPFAAKCAWLFKAYGHDAISIVDGGWQRWFDSDYDVSMDNVFLPKGNWRAENRLNTHTVGFEELEKKDENGKEMIQRTDEINFFDSRGRGQFDGTEDTGLDPYQVNGTHVPGFKNCPAAELLTQDGLIKSEEEIAQWLQKNGYKSDQPVVTSCNMGLTASFLAYAIEDVVKGTPRLYSGSLKEMELRAPAKISGGPQHIPPKLRATL